MLALPKCDLRAGWSSRTSEIAFLFFQDLSYKDKHWHEACFLCNKCRVSLVDKQFGSKADKIYCGNCYDAQFASRCDGCGEIFRAGEFDSPFVFIYSCLAVPSQGQFRIYTTGVVLNRRLVRLWQGLVPAPQSL
jgi:hypothetical protein